jgi:hypothetical protein
MGRFASLNLRQVRTRSGGDDDGVGGEHLDQPVVDRGLQPDFDPEIGKLLLEIGNKPAKLRPARQHLR